MSLAARDEDHYKYGIVIDSGSSGSRLQVYRWEDPQYLQKNSNDASTLNSVPKIYQESTWNHKISPGISSFRKKPGKIWDKHFKELIQFAENIIPESKYEETPIFVLATAGMRLIKQKEQDKILEKTCKALQSKTKFYIPNCEDFVQIIDGETEGIYGWVGLNYLMDQFNEYKLDDETHKSIGFMDMGGASTQIAFVPSDKEQITKHQEDLSNVYLRSVNGETQNWNVFVSTWLGFGANEARKRYLNQLISLTIPSSSKKSKVKQIIDPCLPKGAVTKYEYNDKKYTVTGAGEYEICLKTIYPLLLKNLPCKDSPCLFNGVHGPQLDFKKDKFVGISEYWYTANDIFQSGGEYNFQLFNERVKEYCEDDWSNILAKSSQGEYSNLPESFLTDACFKASWVINVLHEGFELPRIGIETSDNMLDGESNKLSDVHIPFKSASSVNGDELSWTLGKILLFAASQVPNINKEHPVGIVPSEILQVSLGRTFVPGGSKDSDDVKAYSTNILYPLLTIVILFLVLFCISRKWANKITNSSFNNKFLQNFNFNSAAIGTRFKNFKNSFPLFKNDTYYDNQLRSNLEEGLISPSRHSFTASDSVLRTRSTINLEDYNFANKQFTNNDPSMLPKRNKSTLFPSLDFENIRENLKRSASASVLKSKSSYE